MAALKSRCAKRKPATRVPGLDGQTLANMAIAWAGFGLVDGFALAEITHYADVVLALPETNCHLT